MEVTPIGLRDVSVSSGIGAKLPHGRDTSPSVQQAEPDDEFVVKRELPVDLAAVRLAESLRRSDPGMDAITAQKIAKQLLEPPPVAKWETEDDVESRVRSVDAQA